MARLSTMTKITATKKERLFPKPITETHRTNRQFDYIKETVAGDIVKLAFSLRIDNDSELKVFKDLLEKALGDVEKELNKHTGN